MKLLLVLCSLFLYDPAAVQGLKCNVCSSILKGSDTISACANPDQYSLQDCTTILSKARFCVILNGNYTIVQNKLPQIAIGPRRTCQFDLDRYEIYEDRNLQPGCRDVNITKRNYLTFDFFHFDGQVCLCDEDNCNTGDRGVMRAPTPYPRPRGNANTATPTLSWLSIILLAGFLMRK